MTDLSDDVRARLEVLMVGDLLSRLMDRVCSVITLSSSLCCCWLCCCCWTASRMHCSMRKFGLVSVGRVEGVCGSNE